MSDVKSDRETLSAMIEDIKGQLQIVNGAAIKPEHFSLEKYKEIEEVHQMVMGKSNFSVSEMEAIIAELATMRDKSSEE
ncbi:DUF1128 domain-containing protein [Salisediminibacterium halotolerans]|uniref:Uncharacterized protein YfkK, UPF0435 family n=1 Tax=Salisediminibacterium halotolerans TaxID=517425 RepID=A0A1H9Q015_9BACI|nr:MULTISPECIES: DUF1128 domain-containing protein [Salisediminibacterium]RLJ74253.1 uncharacterized protein YfkK (UPF0435 family) [Actinophytocola xinjiangensis]RPE87655.1 uncharacterized protein YfkK (UPF0435 family) [Salisediminibacterium halotolerans]TWG35090.1 uncharacterized protein YfkK (UPF0435 family) [Salisediminibacterium halotolerans]SER53764.1 Uncharacterized protein YfkK, UPF0435 family [Salisediminibacterium haloalkalitolerans]GEL06862.1 hypothetical protein SHA02_02780 [Salised